MTKHTGFLYGHYDSRGCATFLEAKTKEEADFRYVEMIFEGWDPAERTKEYEKELIEGDFIAPCEIEGPISDGEDIEYREDGQTLWTNIPSEWPDGIANVEFRVAKECPGEGWHESNFGEDAAGVIFIAEEDKVTRMVKEAMRFYYEAEAPKELDFQAVFLALARGDEEMLKKIIKQMGA